MEDRRTLRAVVYGAGVILLVFVVLLAIGGAIGASLISWSSYRSLINVTVVWASLCAIFAFAAGGWVAGKTYSGRDVSVRPGLLAGLAALLLLGIAFYAATERYGDLRSLGIELGLVEVPNIDRMDAPIFGAEGDPLITPSDEAYIVLAETALYVVGMTVLELSAAILGALAAQYSSDAARGTARSYKGRKSTA